MSHDTHSPDTSIKDLKYCGPKQLLELTEKWEDPYPQPMVKIQHLPDGRKIHVVREDLLADGSKARFASALMQSDPNKTLVYVAPRVGWAPLSLCKVAKIYKRRVILFAPAAKEPSNYQRVAHDWGAELRFCRIAAMQNLQAMAKTFADKHGYLFMPLGLDVPIVTSAVARTALSLAWGNKSPKEVWSVVSTGVLTRGLQVAWPKAKFYGVAVARNLKAGEKGAAYMYSHPKPFLDVEDEWQRPPFPSATNYDAKAWRYILGFASDNAWFWNVASDPCQPSTNSGRLKSDVAWGDMRCFNKP